jgi:hypothetical protein
MKEVTKTVRKKPTVKKKVSPQNDVETYRSLKDGEVKLTAKEKRMAELVSKAIE